MLQARVRQTVIEVLRQNLSPVPSDRCPLLFAILLEDIPWEKITYKRYRMRFFLNRWEYESVSFAAGRREEPDEMKAEQSSIWLNRG